jgi:hypothetical protein
MPAPVESFLFRFVCAKDCDDINPPAPRFSNSSGEAGTFFRRVGGFEMDGSDYPVSTQGEGRCPRCGEGTLKVWYELSEEEREVARRLPGSADFTTEERAARHRFCTRCWYEDGGRTPLRA